MFVFVCVFSCVLCVVFVVCVLFFFCLIGLFLLRFFCGFIVCVATRRTAARQRVMAVCQF